MRRAERRATRFLSVLVVMTVGVGLSVVLLVGADCGFQPVDVEDCPSEEPGAVIDVAGTYRYSGEGENAESGAEFRLSGTITFEQEGTQVRVTDTTYDFSGLRRLEGGFTELAGNRLVIQLLPINGDDDYTADVTFIFTPDGNAFCVAFDDTNDDSGEMGSFRGERSPMLP